MKIFRTLFLIRKLMTICIQQDQVVLSTNLLFKPDVSLSLVNGELLQNTVDVASVTYKLGDIRSCLVYVLHWQHLPHSEEAPR